MGKTTRHKLVSYVDDEELQRFKLLARYKGKSMSTLVIDLMEEEIRRIEKAQKISLEKFFPE